MKAFLFSFLALGLTGVFAAPASEGELNTRSPCNLLCKPGYTAVYNLVTKRCKCVLNNEEICLRETICIGTHHPVWDPTTKTCTCEPYDFSAEENCLIATTCLEGSHPFWNSATKKCTCNPNDGEFICKAATTCIPSSTPIWHPETETCVCEKVAKRQEDFPDPKTCPTIRCMEGYTPKYVPGLAHCICEKNPVPDPKTCPTIKCSAGYKPVYNPKTKTCSCKPDPTQCVGWVCIAEKQPVYDPTTGKCGCQWIPGLEPIPVDPCADIFCIAEMTPKVNATTGLCECEWIPGLEPGTPTTKRSVAVEEAAQIEERVPEAAAEPQTLNPGCRGIYCIAEQHPVYNATSKRCECEWIPGLEPGGPTASSRSVAVEEAVEVEERAAEAVPEPQRIHPACVGILCIAEKHPVYNATSKRCECEWIPGFGPLTLAERQEKPTPTPYDPLNCYWLKVYCEGGDHHMHYDPKSKSCKCPPVTTKPTPTPTPTPTAVQLRCEDLKVYCEFGDHYMHWDPVSQTCKCPEK